MRLKENILVIVEMLYWMTKVIKTSSIELAADFEEIFDGANVEEATKKAYNQKNA